MKHVTCVGKMRIFTLIYIRILHVGTSTDLHICILPVTDGQILVIGRLPQGDRQALTSICTLADALTCVILSSHCLSSFGASLFILMTYIQNDELFVPELAKHFRSREQNIDRENFRSSGTFIRSLELSLLSCDCSMKLSPNYTGAKVLGTFASKERQKFQGANVPWNGSSFCGLFAVGNAKSR